MTPGWFWNRPRAISRFCRLYSDELPLRHSLGGIERRDMDAHVWLIDFCAVQPPVPAIFAAAGQQCDRREEQEHPRRETPH
jgi:hypothetical protein